MRTMTFWAALMCIASSTPFAPTANAALLVDSFGTASLRITHEDMKANDHAGFGLSQSPVPGVLGEVRGVSLGSIHDGLLTDPLADVEFSIRGGQLSVTSNYFAERSRLRYGGPSNHLGLDLTDIAHTTLVVEFDYFNNFGAQISPSFQGRVGATDENGELRPYPPDPFYYAHSPETALSEKTAVRPSSRK